jgi:hypothetical protein
VLYLLDANVLIDAARDYYPLEMVPEFWNWLEHQGAAGAVKMPLEISEEISSGTDALAAWCRSERTKTALILDEEVEQSSVARAVSEGYASDLTDDEILQAGRDPFLIAYAMVAPSDRCVVTTEVSKSTRVRGNRHIPDVCATLGVKVCHTFEFLRRLGFSTQWKP